MKTQHQCPVWLGYFLISPLRKWMHHPGKLLGEYLKPGMKVIDYGSAMGYFSLPMARMVSENGKVFCMDIQQRMLNKLYFRAIKANLSKIIEPILLNEERGNITELMHQIDFALLFAVAHEVPDREKLFRDLSFLLKGKGLLLFAEPVGHVSKEEFRQSIIYAEKAGFVQKRQIPIRKCFGVLLERNDTF